MFRYPNISRCCKAIQPTTTSDSDVNSMFNLNLPLKISSKQAGVRHPGYLPSEVPGNVEILSVITAVETISENFSMTNKQAI